MSGWPGEGGGLDGWLNEPRSLWMLCRGGVRWCGG